ncbi:MAG: RDD family protein [bacterium]|nr:RDD family protein [bacterium]MCP4966912.1 RDD family protein [bacterium]
MDTDHIEITTPEGFSLQLVLAGLGSRSAAAIVDTSIIVACSTLAYLPLLNSDAPAPARIILQMMPLVLFFGYHIAFETLGRRQSPGKRLLRLRIVRTDGSPMGATGSLVRNLLRIVDFLPFAYLVGMATVFSSTSNQRLGDIAAGVVVVMEPKAGGDHETSPLPSAVVPEGWDVSAVTDEDIAMMTEFMARRTSLDTSSRGTIGLRLANRIDAKVSRPPQHMSSEDTIETVLRLKQQHS